MAGGFLGRLIPARFNVNPLKRLSYHQACPRTPGGRVRAPGFARHGRAPSTEWEGLLAGFIQEIWEGHGQDSDGRRGTSAPDCRGGDAVIRP
jgi:hypothetical protein